MGVKLTETLAQKRLEIQKMTQAIALIESPPPSDLPLDRSKLDTLSRLEQLLDQAQNKDERQQRLELAKQALLESGKELRALEVEVARLERLEVESLQKLDTAIAKFNQLGEEQAAIAAQISQLSRDSASAIAQLRGTAIFCPLPPKSAAVARYGSQILFEN